VVSEGEQSATNPPFDNVAAVNESEWRLILDHARTAGWPEYQALVEAASAAPELRCLFPDMQHWVLFFADCSADLFLAPKNFCLEPPSELNGDHYTMRETWQGPPLAQTSTAAEIIALAVQRLSSDADAARDVNVQVMLDDSASGDA
jgi:Family of unknown function (DUF6193)